MNMRTAGIARGKCVREVKQVVTSAVTLGIGHCPMNMRTAGIARRKCVREPLRVVTSAVALGIVTYFKSSPKGELLFVIGDPAAAPSPPPQRAF